MATAWASAASFRSSDKRGGANGARLRLEPQKSWAVNNPARTAKVIEALEKVKADFDTASKQVSMADLIVLAGGVGVEMAADAAGNPVVVPFTPGRTDATQEQTDVEQFAWLEPRYDGFRNYLEKKSKAATEYLLLDRANLLGVSAPEMTVLVAGLRVLDTNWDGSETGVLTERPGELTQDFLVNLLEQQTWSATDETEEVFTSSNGWTGSRVDLVFGSNSELRALAEVYAADDAQEKFVKDFAAAWAKVMENDRFDLR